MALTDKSNKRAAGGSDRRNIWLLIVTTLLLVLSVVMFMPPQEKINQGLDIQGGLSVVLTAKSTDGEAIDEETMESSRAIIENRVNASVEADHCVIATASRRRSPMISATRSTRAKCSIST